MALLFKYCLFIATLLIAFPLESALPAEDMLRRMSAHLLLEDYENAIEEGKKAVAAYPDSFLIYEAYIKSLAKGGKSHEVYDEWAKFSKKFPERAYQSDLLEEICFGIVEKGQRSSSLNIRTISLIGIALTQDIRAVHAIGEALRDSNANIRAIAAPLASHYGDESLKKILLHLLQEEKKIKVRLAVIGAVGQLKMKQALPSLYDILRSNASSKEKIKAVVSIVNIEETIADEEIDYLATQPLAAFRLLACEAISVLHKKHYPLCRLIRDTNPEVKKAAIKAVATCKVEEEEVKKALIQALSFPDPEVKMTAAWALLTSKDLAGIKALEYWLTHGTQEERLMAAGAIRSAGPYGVEIAKKWLGKTGNAFIEANLALACLEQRVEVDRCAKIIDTFFQSSKEQWMQEEVGDGTLSYLKKGNLSHNPLIPNYPEAVNQVSRLEVLNLLAIVGYSRAEEMIKEFLKEKRWGITGIAAELLLEEGDTSAIDLIKALLKDPDPEIRVHAALALAVWGKDDSSLPILLESYNNADWTLKVKILEACGGLGDAKCIPFLVGNLGHPSETLRMITAAVLLQTLFH